MRLLAGDIGGTKTNLAVYEEGRGLHDPLLEATQPSGAYGSLPELVETAIGPDVLGRVEAACFGVAGPVVNGRARGTNLSWLLDEDELAGAFGVGRVTLLNDLLAIAHAVPSLEATDIETLNAGEHVAGGVKAVVAPGTGLGEAYLIWDGKRYLAQPSEGGHADFAPNSDVECELLAYLRRRHEHVSYERVCSGRAIPVIYDFLKTSGFAAEPEWMTARLEAAPDASPVIVEGAMGSDPTCALCAETMRLFVSVLGAEAGNMALKLLAFGGIYLGGGIPPRILPFLRRDGFLRAFCSKGRLSDMIRRIPVHVIRNPKVALLGAACYGLEQAAVAP